MPLLKQTYALVISMLSTEKVYNQWYLMTIYLLVVSLLVLFAVILTKFFDRVDILRFLYKGR